MSKTRAYAEVVEGIRATIAAYAQALDDGRTDDVVATFCPDGVSEIAGMGTYEGHDALREAYAGWKPRRPQRHLVLNTLVTSWIAQPASPCRTKTTSTARGGSTAGRPSSCPRKGAEHRCRARRCCSSGGKGR